MNEMARAETQSTAVALPVERVLSAVIAAASDPSVDVAKMRELLGLQKELMAMQAEQQFNEAFHRLSFDMPRIKKGGAVEYKGKIAFHFATWEGIDTIIRPLLQREGFTLSFDSVQRQGDGGGLLVTGTLSHVGGHKRTASIPVPLDSSGGKNAIQGYGSALSYGRRYTTTALLNIVTEGEDDDGVRGGKRFIQPEAAEDLRALLLSVGRQEGPFLDRFFGGTVRSFEEIEEGPGHLAARSTLEGIKRQLQAKAS